MEKNLNKIERETLDELLARIGIEHFDLLLIGDGSGSNWEREVGWGCVSIESDTFAREAWYGGMNAGTINLAEMLAYLQPISWYAQRELDRRKKVTYKVEIKHVHVLTDSSYVAGKGSSKDLLSGPHKALWQVFKQFGAYGINIHWHWINRDTVELNKFADKLSKAVRLNFKNNDFQKLVEEKSFRPPRTIYECNPSE